MTRIALGTSSGRKVVTSAGTPERLVDTETPCFKVEISGLESNTDIVVVGASTVVAGTSLDGAGTRKGTPISAGQTLTVEIDNPYKLFIDAVVSGEGVSFTYYY